MNIRMLLRVVSAAFFFALSPLAQAQTGTVANHSFAVGKGPGVTGFTSLLCTSAQLAVGQAAADPICQTITGDVTISAGGVTAIGANKVTNAQIRQSGALSLLGRSANSTGNVADISATPASSCVFMESSSTLTCAAIATANIASSAVTYAKVQNVAASRLLGNPTGSPAAPSEISLGSTLAFSGTALQTTALTGDVTATANSFATTIAANAVTNAKMATMAANTVKANATGSTAVPTDVAPSSARSSSLLNIDSFTGHGDSIYTILATDRTVGTNAAFTASRTWTLPAANAVNPGQEIIVADFQGTVTGVNTLVISRAGADTVNGGTSVTISSANGAYMLKSDGTSKWTAQALGAAAAGGVSSITAGTGLSGGTITTSGTIAVNLPFLTNSISAGFNLNNTALYFDGPSVAQGTSGTWFASGQATVASSTAGDNIICKLWDGTTVIDVSNANITSVGNTMEIHLSGALATPAGNIKISCKDATSINGAVNANSDAITKASTVTVFRIQ
jgi:hypothetical protein